MNNSAKFFGEMVKETVCYEEGEEMFDIETSSIIDELYKGYNLSTAVLNEIVCDAKQFLAGVELKKILETRNIKIIDAIDSELERSSDTRLTANEAKKLEKLILTGNSNAKKRLTDGYGFLVILVAARYFNGEIPFEILIDSGKLGLKKAINKYDYTKGYDFCSYAVNWISNNIARVFLDKK